MTVGKLKGGTFREYSFPLLFSPVEQVLNFIFQFGIGPDRYF